MKKSLNGKVRSLGVKGKKSSAIVRGTAPKRTATVSGEYLVHSKSVVFRSSDSHAQATTIIDIKRARVYSLNRTGTLIWRLIDGSKNSQQIIDALGQKFSISDQLGIQIAEFLKELVQAELISTKSSKSRTLTTSGETFLKSITAKDKFVRPCLSIESLEVLNVFAGGPGH